MRLKELDQDATGVELNFALVNVYEPGANLGWHSDDEEDMVNDSIVFSLSFGVGIPFDLEERRQNKERIRKNLIQCDSE